MKKIILLVTFILPLIIFGCGKKENTAEQKQKNDSVVQNNDTKKTGDKTASDSVDKNNLNNRRTKRYKIRCKGI